MLLPSKWSYHGLLVECILYKGPILATTSWYPLLRTVFFGLLSFVLAFVRLSTRLVTTLAMHYARYLLALVK